MITGDDQVDLIGVGGFGGVVYSGAIGPAEVVCFAFAEGRVEDFGIEEVRCQVDFGGHDDGVQVEPPDPFGLGVFFEGVFQGGNFGPYWMCIADTVFREIGPCEVIAYN